MSIYVFYSYIFGKNTKNPAAFSRMWIRQTFTPFCKCRFACVCYLHKMFVIALSHIHASAAYRSRIYENFDTPRSEPYFARATYVPRTCDVPATFPLRIRDVSVFVWNFTFVCTAYHGVCFTYV